MLAAKALASLHICTGSPEPRHSYEISSVGANGDLCAIHASSYCTFEQDIVTGYCNKYQYFICWHAAKALASLHICKARLRLVTVTKYMYHVLVQMAICVPFM